MSPFTELPAELHISIANICSTADIKRLCSTCHLLHSRLLPELYHTIDLSSHNESNNCEPWGRDTHEKPVPSSFSERYWETFDRRAFSKQKMFVRTIQGRSEYAEYVRNLHWTVIDTSGNFWGERVVEREDGEGDGHNEEWPLYVPKDEPLWETFQALVNLDHVDLCWIRQGHLAIKRAQRDANNSRAWREVTLPESLFPSAKSIRLSGCMSRSLVTCILRPQAQGPSILTHLELNDLSQWSETTPPFPPFPHLRELQSYYADHEDDQGHEHVPGSRQMLDALDPLTGHCPHLTSLRIAILGPCEESGPESREKRLYESCARFLGSVRKTLKTLDFEQGYNYNDQASYDNAYEPREMKFPRPMDRLFARHVLPVLLERAWPCMERMEISGVGNTKRQHGRATRPTEEERKNNEVVLEDVRECIEDGERWFYWNIVVVAFPSAADMQVQLQRLVPHGSVVVDEDGDQNFETFMEDSYGIQHDS